MNVVDLSLELEITSSAQAHFLQLIEKENVADMALRIFVDRPGLPQSEVGISFCPPGEEHETDLSLSFPGFTLFVDRPSLDFLQNAKINYKEDDFGGQLAITAPNLKGKPPSEDASLVERITYILNTEINPNLAQHGGMVSLVEVTDKQEVILRFGGGCQGCGMVDVTLKEGIERTLKERLPMITAVKDVTDHSQGDNPYY